MGMTDLCYPYGDSALRDGGCQNQKSGAQILFLRFSDKPANGFLYNLLTDLLLCRLVIF